MIKALKIVLLGLLIFIMLLGISLYAFLQHPQFGGTPEGERLERIQNSPNLTDGEFRNLEPDPVIVRDEDEPNRSFLFALIHHFTNRPDELFPDGEMPSVFTNLHALDNNRDLIIWFGHSSFFVQLGGVRILVDPVFSRVASPVPFINRAFDGTTVYTTDDIPEVDYILISHDHWDHLDYPTLRDMEPKTGEIVAGLGVGAHIERWGYEPERILESDWWDRIERENGFTIHVVPARHYSSRMLDRNRTLWAGYVIETPERRIYISGDSGYGVHIREIASRFGHFDLVAPDFGQYDNNWPHIHKTPEEAAQTAMDLGADALILNHIGKFAQANHTWDDPFIRIANASEGKNFRLLTPKIGEPVYFDEMLDQPFTRWWEDVE